MQMFLLPMIHLSGRKGLKEKMTGFAVCVISVMPVVKCFDDAKSFGVRTMP